MGEFHTLAYALQEDCHRRERAAQGESADSIVGAWFDETTADYWRQSRMYEFARHFATDSEASWLTVGDGRFGIDSIELKKRGIKQVLPTDISELALKEAKQKNWIADYAVENAEKLSFRDGQFDYVLCKESYHHFPRPFIALYEMLRVASTAVILVEPNDFWKSSIGYMLFGIKRLLGKAKHIDQGRYEESGNYVYSISEREIEKVSLGIDLPVVFFKGLNDVYIPGGEYAPARWSSPVFFRMRLLVLALDVLCMLRLFKPTRLMVCLFKREPSTALAQSLLKDGWTRISLPRNPYRPHNDSCTSRCNPVATTQSRQREVR
jgi:SAM-dependent methyltransferase